MTRRTSRKLRSNRRRPAITSKASKPKKLKMKWNSRRRTSRRLRANFDAEIGAQIRETVDNLRREGNDLLSQADEIADAWREKDLHGLFVLRAITKGQYKMLARERDQA